MELALRDGWSPPPALPRGECTVSRLEDGSIRIDQADPRVMISGELLDIIATDPAPGVVLDTSKCCECFRENDYTEAVLKINGVNRQVIYHITEYVPSVHGYIGQWPD